MPQSLVKIYLHIVFSTKGRRPFLQDAAVRNELHRYLGGVCNHWQCPVVQIGGAADHVHVLCCLGREMTIANLIKELKNDSSKWVKTKAPGLGDFHWQSGYAAFTVGPEDVDAVHDYILHQEDHHRSISFEDEFRKLLTINGMEWDERYVWD